MTAPYADPIPEAVAFTREFALHMNAALIVGTIGREWGHWREKDPMAMMAGVSSAMEALIEAIAKGAEPSAVWVAASDVAVAAAKIADAYETQHA